MGSQVTKKLVLPLEGFGASWADLQTSLFVADQFCQNAELHWTPRAGALDSFLADSVDQLNMALQIPICSTHEIH